MDSLSRAPAPTAPGPDGRPDDPYRWLEETEAPRTRTWLDHQRDQLHSATAEFSDAAWGEALTRTERTSAGRLLSPPAEAGGLVFRHEHHPGGNRLTVHRCDGYREVLLDCGKQSDARSPGRIAGWHTSPTGDLLAVQLHHDGREHGGLRLIPTRPGGSQEEHLRDASPFPALAFIDGWLLYSAGTRTEHTLVARRLDTGAATDVALPITGVVRLSLHSGPGSHLILRTRTAHEPGGSWWVTRWTGRGTPDWQPLAVEDLGVTALDLSEDTCYLAGPEQIFGLDLGRIARGDAAGPHPVGSGFAKGQTRVRALRVLGPATAPRLAVLRQTGTTRRLDVHAVTATATADHGPGFTWQSRLRLGPVVRDHDGKGGDALWILADDPRDGGWSRRLAGTDSLLDRSTPTVASRPPLRTLTVESRDGTPVPVTICDPVPAAPCQPAPTVVTVYGGFGVPLEPTWDPMLATWLHAGGRIAWVHARGGGELGPAWAAAGQGPGKSAVVDDLCAAAAALLEQHETTPGRMAALGASNGGLITAAALVRAPHLFSAVVCAAPLTDMARYRTGGLGRLWSTEYGDPDDPEQLRGLLSYSPYHNVTADTPYPAALFITGGNDDRVPPWHAWKLCASLQQATTGTSPVLLDHHDGSGHHGRSGTAAHAVGTRVLEFLGTRTGLRPRAIGSGSARQDDDQ